MTKDFEPVTEVAIHQDEFGEGETLTCSELKGVTGFFSVLRLVISFSALINLLCLCIR